MLFLVRKIPLRSKVMSHYHYCMGNNMGEGKCALGCITFACVACTDQIDHAWITTVF